MDHKNPDPTALSDTQTWEWADRIRLSAILDERAMSKADEILVALRRVMRATDLHSKQLFKSIGLTSPQLLIMQILHREGSITAGQLADRVSLSQATVTTILDRLQAKALIQRERSETDRRKVFVLLTEQGANKLQNAPTPLQEDFIRQFADLKNWEQTQLISALQRIAHMMDAHHIDASPVLDTGELLGSMDQHKTGSH